MAREIRCSQCRRLCHAWEIYNASGAEYAGTRDPGGYLCGACVEQLTRTGVLSAADTLEVSADALET